LASLAVDYCADVVHVHLLDGEQVRLLAGGDVPVVVTVHNSQPGWPAHLSAASHSESPPLFIACSRDVAGELRAAGIGATRTIWTGLAQVAAPDVTSEARRNVRIELGVTGDGPLLLAVANHRPQKRLDRLPAVLAAVRARGLDAKLVIVGEPVGSDPESLAVA